MSSTEPVPPPLPQESDEKPAERRFPWPIWVVAGLVYAFFLTVAIRVGDDVPYQAGKYLGSMGIAVLASWGLWRLASRATGAAWGGLLQLAQQHRDLWSLDSDGALVVSEGADPKIDAQFDDAVAEVGTTWDLLEQRSAAFAEWQQSIGGPR